MQRLRLQLFYHKYGEKSRVWIKTNTLKFILDKILLEFYNIYV